MPRKLNPNYLRRIMAQDNLTGLAVVFLTGQQFGVATRNESLLGDDGWVDDDAPERYASDHSNYQGWNAPSKLYCAKCWRVMSGIPREIIAENWCKHCQSALYEYDESRFDGLGNDLYRDQVNRYTQIAVRHFAHLILGNEHLRPTGLVDGYHKDHIYSVREAFEQDLSEELISSPPNLRVIPGRKNISKGRKLGVTLDELQSAYDSFLTDNANWLTLLRESDARQETFIWNDEEH